jgi:hypothetical protein
VELRDAAVAAKLVRTKITHICMIIATVLVSVVIFRMGYIVRTFPTMIGFWVCGVAEVWSESEGTDSRLRRVATMTAACLLGSAAGGALRATLFGLGRLIQLA